ncbi:hypothetical protein NY2A_b872L [Paramecium bursaria Chlorella virus NY2A]|uniref:Uncharacterized protein b872L n=1 Tax=Paramecium bursaria Chlorella virus NY2A TaxID=46021 RepID=A7IY47_PBCVN|nr:hypothetical protein NY2A_b872L [Paramecium bursaria Chlorella virus NY2A]ABT15271.1 hypothetical protein NY2A_b872L [Paramecium bursaria Chlorella virus NY2A]
MHVIVVIIYINKIRINTYKHHTNIKVYNGSYIYCSKNGHEAFYTHDECHFKMLFPQNQIINYKLKVSALPSKQAITA